jgi:hypothetical protein
LLRDAERLGQLLLREAVSLARVGDALAQFSEKFLVRRVHGEMQRD